MNVDNYRPYRLQRIAHWNGVALSRWQGLGAAYHRRLVRVYRSIVPPGARVLEVGCGTGDLLAALEPSEGVGIDFSRIMVHEAQRRYPHLRFVLADAHAPAIQGSFDFIILSDLVNDVWDVQIVLEALRPLCHSRTRLVMNTYSKLWEIPLKIASTMRLIRPRLQQNWLTLHDLRGLLRLSGFEVVRQWQEVLWPVWTPLIEKFFNRILSRIFPLNHLCLCNVVVARALVYANAGTAPTVSVVVPARNEAGNIAGILERTPLIGSATELIFVEGNSSDSTYETIERCISSYTRIPCRLLRQTGRGKGDAVRLGFANARGDILIILDADMTVAPEDLPRFYHALASGLCEFANGVRLVYPLGPRSMRFANLIGNKFFGAVFSWLIGQPIRDTLCGTKALWREDYERIVRHRSYFGEFDPFGDFDLLFGAAKLNLKILDIPVRYHERTYGTTNIQRWRHGLILLKMVLFGGRKLRLI